MARTLFWISLLIIFYIYFGYTALCILLGLLFNRQVKKKEIYPTISIIIPCYNEEKVIRGKLENLLSLDYPMDKLQIIVVSESTDKTNEIVSKYKNIELYKYGGRLGKTVLLYNAVPQARGEILVFTDANVMLKKDCLKKISSNFYEERIGAVTGLLEVDNPEASPISWGEKIYKKYETILRKSNSQLRRVLNSDGALFAIRRGLYRPISPERGDDFELVIRVLIDGYHSVFEPEAIAYESASIATKGEIARKIRMVSWFIRSTIILIKDMLLKFRFGLIFQIFSHKLLRWTTPYFLIAFFISNISLWKEGLFYQSILIVQISVYCMGLLGWYMSDLQKKKPPLLLGAMQYFLMFNYAFLIGTIKGIFSGKTSPVWDKVRS